LGEDSLRLTRKCECGKHTFEELLKKPPIHHRVETRFWQGYQGCVN